MATDFSSSTRRLFRSLIYLAVQRCRIAETLCRLSVSIRCFRVSNPPFMRISISDTGVGSSLVEFQDLDRGMCSVSSDKWDGMLSITTTGIRDKDIHNYHLNLREALTSKLRLNTLPPTCKNHGTFSGTEVCFSTAEEDNIDDFMAWVFPFVQKIFLLKTPNLAVDLTVEHTENLGLRYNHLHQETDDIYLPLSLSNNERLLLSLQSYVLRHRNALDKECQLCFTSRDHLKFGTGVASNIQNVRDSGRIVEVAIVITSVQSQCCLWRLSYATSQVMYFQEFTPFSVTQSSIDALTSINWQNYGLRLREIIMDGDGNAVLEWVDMPSFGYMDIAIHCYHQRIVTQERTSADRNLIKKAVKIALDDLKAKYAGLLLSFRSVKIRNHIPDLSRTIAGLILSSNDPEFHSECASLLGLQSNDACTEETVDSCIREKIIRIIEMNDGKKKKKIERGSAPCLFECEGHLKEHCPEGKDDDSEEVNFDMELRAKYYIANKIWISDSLETSVAIERITEAWHIDFTFLHEWMAILHSTISTINHSYVKKRSLPARHPFLLFQGNVDTPAVDS
ncbi:type 2 DNA topoisomerase 6 subunit B-like isoform X2 [Musa acuminata AAA Group]|uniref:type 2 DNA topoisomerase 6 subunit B-like isoform X2 n=1 Tax=Musa acuminata AAA Group TaxID=214697 RepID=UPI0031DC922E